MRAVRTELVRLRTDDGAVLDGARWWPAGAPPSAGFALCPGTATEFFSGWLGWLGGRLAREGFAAVALNRRDHGALAGFHDMETAAMDQRYAIDLLGAAGVERVVLAGHSYGTLTVPCYMAASGDPRVAALVLYAPLGDLRQATVEICGGREEYERVVAQARAMVAAGRGQEAFMIAPMIPGGLPLVHSYEVFLRKRGPEASTVGPDLLRRLAGLPVLAIRDPHDPFPATRPPTQQQLEAVGSHVRYVLLSDRGPSANAHGFEGRENEVLGVTLDWLGAQGIRP